MWLMASLTDSFNTLKDSAAPERRTSRRILTVKEICLLIQPQLAEVQTGENVCASRETLKKCAIKTISVWVLKAAQCLCQGGHKLQAIKRFSPFNPVNDAWAKPKPSSTNERGSWQPHGAFLPTMDCHCLFAQHSSLHLGLSHLQDDHTWFPYKTTVNWNSFRLAERWYGNVKHSPRQRSLQAGFSRQPCAKPE